MRRIVVPFSRVLRSEDAQSEVCTRLEDREDQPAEGHPQGEGPTDVRSKQCIVAAGLHEEREGDEGWQKQYRTRNELCHGEIGVLLWNQQQPGQDWEKIPKLT